MIWGELSAWLTSRQDHRHEIERMQLSANLESAQFARQQEAIRLQAELGVKTIQVQAEADLDRIAGEAWGELVSSTTRMTGIRFVDVWNQSIRPLLATLSIAVVVARIYSIGFVLTEWDQELVAAILGLYIADRSLSKRGK
jgi:hypothetical protein